MSNFFEQNNQPLTERIAFGFERLATALRHNAWQESTPQRLTPTQAEILTLLRRRPGATLKEVSALLGVRPATASGAVRVLVDKGWIEKARSLKDRRALWLQLTTGGRKLADRTARWSGFLAAATEGLEELEGHTLLKALAKIIRKLQEEERIPAAQMCITCTFFRPRIHSNPQGPHHCSFVDAPFGDGDLRLDCSDHTPAKTSTSI
jgi:DNA-binding MarR family transcriptional regulator